MPGTAIAPQTPSSSGLVPAFATPAAANSVPNGNRVLIYVKNASGGSINVTIKSNATADGTAFADKVVAVPAAGEKIIGPFSSGIYNYGDGTIEVDFSATASVTWAVFQIA